MSRMLTVKEAAERLHVHLSTIYRWVDEDLIEHERRRKPSPIKNRRTGGAIQIPERVVDELLREAEQHDRHLAIA